MKLEQVVVVVFIGFLLWLWSGQIVVDCSRFNCVNTSRHIDE